MRSMPILQRTYRAPFLFLMALIYWAQGFRSFAWMGVSSQMRHKLRLRPSTSQFVVSTAFIPWSVKPAIGAKPAGDLETISGLAMTFGGIIGSICGGLGLAVLNVEGIFLLLSLFPLLQLLAYGMMDDETLGQVAMSIDEGSCNIYEDDDGEILNIDILKTTNLVADYFGMLSFLDDEDEYLDNMKLEGFSQNRTVYYNDAVATVRLPWTHDLDPERIEKVLKKISNETFENGTQGDDDWIQIGSDGLEKETPELNTTSPKIKPNTQVVLTMYPSERSVEDFDFLKMDCILKRREYPGEDLDLNLDQRGDSEEQLRQRRSHDIKSSWQSLFDAIKRPTPLQPLIWFIVSQFILPNISTIMLYYQTTNLKLESSILGTSRMLNLSGLMLATFFFNYLLKHLPLWKTLWHIKERDNFKEEARGGFDCYRRLNVPWNEEHVMSEQ